MTHVKHLLFLHSHTLHAKVTIPLALRLAQDGYQVSYLVNRPTFLARSFGFSARYVRSHPTAVAIINPESLRYVARLIGYEQAWQEGSRKIGYVWRRGLNDYGRFDGLVSTTKDMRLLRRIRERYSVPAFAVGYQHIPFLVKIDEQFRPETRFFGENLVSSESAFLTDNAFSRAHRFPDILQSCGLYPCGFTYLDRVYAGRQEQEANRDERTVLIFHPGGYRRVLTEPGDSREVCYARQRAFFEKLCLPLVKAGLRPVIKIHPLCARFHDLPDVEKVAREIEAHHRLPADSILCIGPESWYWKYAFQSRFILTFGSSSVYELWSSGLSNVFVCNFEGGVRSQKFRFFNSIFIDGYEEYLDFVSAEVFRHRPLDALATQVFDAYHSLFDGQATRKVCGLINQELRS